MGKLEQQYVDPATHEADFAKTPGRFRRQQDLS
jgi:hypothetical protein